MSKQKKANSIAIIMNLDKKNPRSFEEDVRQAKKQGFDKIYTIDFLFDTCESQLLDWSKHNASKIHI